MITVDELKQLLDKNEPLHLLDVRTENERQAFHIGGQHIPLQELPERIAEIPVDDKPIIIYCKSGVRSQVAVEMLDEAGIDNACNLIGGIIAWQELVG